MAGDEAMIRQATRTAARSYSRAITLLLEDGEAARATHRDDLITLHAHRGDARALQSDGDAAYADYKAALALWRDYPCSDDCTPEEERQTGMRLYRRLVTLPARYASWFRALPPHEELRDYLTAGLDLARANGDEDSLDLAALLAAQSFFWWSWPQGRGNEQLRQALSSAEEAVAITERADEPRAASEALDALGSMQATVTNLRGYLASQTRRLYLGRAHRRPQ